MSSTGPDGNCTSPEEICVNRLLVTTCRWDYNLNHHGVSSGQPIISKGGLELYDVTSSSYEGRTHPLVHFGHNRDGLIGQFPFVKTSTP